MKKLLYVGPSWAFRSYDTATGTELEYTNLALELNLNVVNLSKPAADNSSCLRQVSSYTEPYDGIIWIYCEPITEIINNDIEQGKRFVESDNFWQIRKELNQHTLKKINHLNKPVALVGAHSDIEDCNYDNITVIHNSWQQFLAKAVGIPPLNGWGAEIAHRMIVKNYPKVKPTRELVIATSDTLKFWNKLEMKGVFNSVHPNRKGTEMFAKEISTNVQSFINNL